MADYKFKRGDRVRTIFKNVHGKDKGQTGTIAEDSRIPYVDWDDGTRTIAGEIRLELIEPKYKKLSPKVGDQFRVVKTLRRGTGHHKAVELPEIITVRAVNSSGSISVQESVDYCYNESNLTTEYLEPVDEETTLPIATADVEAGQEKIDLPEGHHGGQIIFHHGRRSGKNYAWDWYREYIGNFIEERLEEQKLKQKAMNIYRKARMSKDEKILHEAGFMTNCGEPTEAGKDALTFILWEANKKALVEMAQEAIDEQEK